MGRRTVEIVAPGMRTTVQDLGRPGHAAIGVGASGAADRGALGLANRLVGNAEGAPALEVVGGGLQLRAHDACRVAVTGATRPVRVGGHAGACHAPFVLDAGTVLHVGTGGPGTYTYVALDGGIDVPRVLGSASCDVLGGIGPPPLGPGDLVPLGSPARAAVHVDLAPVATPGAVTELRVQVGPRAARFAPDALAVLCSHPWTVTAASDRVALRLHGVALVRTRTDELASEGLLRGAVQVPPDGMPVVFGPDHPTTGGYPVLAVVVDDDLDAAAQAAPGTTVRFRLRT